MNYYLEKKRAYRIIDGMYVDGIEPSKIYFKINSEFAFGKKVVENRISLLEDMGVKPRKDLKEDE